MTNKVIYYPFELHTHTVHSDGGFTPETLIKAVKAQGLKGIALTDHNTATGYKEAALIGSEEGIVVIRGIEWTTFYGHITVLGATDAIDWREVNPKNVCKKAEEVRSAGGAIGIAHPFRLGYPLCTGGSDDWELKLKEYAAFTHYEVWSYLSPSLDRTNALAEKRYDEILSSGVKLSATYGRDWHDARDTEAYAATYLGIKGELNAENALDAVKNGRTYISTGVRLEVGIVSNNGHRFGIGDTAPEGEYALKVALSEFTADYTRIYGVKAEEIKIFGTAPDEKITLSVSQCEEGIKIRLKSGYIRISVHGQIEGAAGELATTSPIYIKRSL